MIEEHGLHGFRYTAMDRCSNNMSDLENKLKDGEWLTANEIFNLLKYLNEKKDREYRQEKKSREERFKKLYAILEPEKQKKWIKVSGDDEIWGLKLVGPHIQRGKSDIYRCSNSQGDTLYLVESRCHGDNNKDYFVYRVRNRNNIRNWIRHKLGTTGEFLVASDS